MNHFQTKNQIFTTDYKYCTHLSTSLRYCENTSDIRRQTAQKKENQSVYLQLPAAPTLLPLRSFPRRRRLSTRSPNSDPTPAAAIGAQPVSRRASFFHHSSRCINGNTKLRQSCSSLARPRFWTDPNDVQTGGFL